MRSRQASTGFILATVGLDALSFGIVVPVIPDLVRQVGHLNEADTSLWLGLIFAIFAGAQFVGAPILGGLGDRFGRRPVLLLSLTVMGLNALSWVVVSNLYWLVAFRLMAGVMAGSVSTASAYLADITPPEGRARAFGLIGAMFGFAFVLGPAVGGWLGGIWLRLPFLASAIMIGCNVLYGALILPESLPPERRRPFSWRRANPLGALALFAASRTSLILGICWCCIWFAVGSQQSSFILANQMRFGWGTSQNGAALALGGIVQALVQGLLIGRLVAGIGPRRTALVGLACALGGYGCYAEAHSLPVMVAGILLLGFGALTGPAIQSMLSEAAGPQRQGETQGALTALQGLSLVVGPLVMGGLFEVATRPGGGIHFPGAPFLLASAACLAALLAITVLPSRARA